MTPDAEARMHALVATGLRRALLLLAICLAVSWVPGPWWRLLAALGAGAIVGMLPPYERWLALRVCAPVRDDEYRLTDAGRAAVGDPQWAGRSPLAEQGHAEWLGWMEANCYSTHPDDCEGMAEAFAAGMQAQRDLNAAPQPR